MESISFKSENTAQRTAERDHFDRHAPGIVEQACLKDDVRGTCYLLAANIRLLCEAIFGPAKGLAMIEGFNNKGHDGFQLLKVIDAAIDESKVEGRGIDRSELLTRYRQIFECLVYHHQMDQKNT